MLREKNATMSKILTDYKRHARKKGVPWELTDEEVWELITSDCHYCGAPPSRGYAGKTNGIDAVDNNEGYTVDNTVPCCKRCNKAKWQLSLPEFEDLILSVYNHYFVKKKSPLNFRGLINTKKNE